MTNPLARGVTISIPMMLWSFQNKLGVRIKPLSVRVWVVCVGTICLTCKPSQVTGNSRSRSFYFSQMDSSKKTPPKSFNTDLLGEMVRSIKAKGGG